MLQKPTAKKTASEKLVLRKMDLLLQNVSLSAYSYKISLIEFEKIDNCEIHLRHGKYTNLYSNEDRL